MSHIEGDTLNFGNNNEPESTPTWSENNGYNPSSKGFPLVTRFIAGAAAFASLVALHGCAQSSPKEPTSIVETTREKTLAERFADGELVTCDLAYVTGSLDNNQLFDLQEGIRRYIADGNDGNLDGSIDSPLPNNLDFRLVEVKPFTAEDFGKEDFPGLVPVSGELPEDWGKLGMEVPIGANPNGGKLDIKETIRRIAALIGKRLGIKAFLDLEDEPETSTATMPSTAPANPPTTFNIARPTESATYAPFTSGPTKATTTKAPTTTKKLETTRSQQQYPRTFSLTSAEEQRSEEQMRVFSNQDIYDRQNNPLEYGPLIYDLQNDPTSGKTGEVAIWLEPFNGEQVVAHIYGKKPGDKEFTKITTAQQAVARAGGSNGDPTKTALINVMYGNVDETGYRNGLYIRYTLQYGAIDIAKGAADMVQFDTKNLAQYKSSNSSGVYDITGFFPSK